MSFHFSSENEVFYGSKFIICETFLLRQYYNYFVRLNLIQMILHEPNLNEATSPFINIYFIDRMGSFFISIQSNRKTKWKWNVKTEKYTQIDFNIIIIVDITVYQFLFSNEIEQISLPAEQSIGMKKFAEKTSLSFTWTVIFNSKFSFMANNNTENIYWINGLH